MGGKRKNSDANSPTAAKASRPEGRTERQAARESISPCHVQLLGTGYDTLECAPSVLLHFARTRYLFGCGESLQRFFLEYGIKLSRIRPVFLTRVDTHAAGGLPGTMLTLMGTAQQIRENPEATEQDSTFTIVGPRPLHSIFDSMRSFVAISQLGLDAREVRDEETEPRTWLIERKGSRGRGWRQLGGQTQGQFSADARDEVHERLGAAFKPVFSDDSALVASTRVHAVSERVAQRLGLPHIRANHTFDPLMPRRGRPAEPGQPAPVLKPVHRPVLAYVVLLPSTRGKFDPEKAKALGLKPGPIFRELTEGRSVQSQADPSLTVTPEMVMSESTPGAVTMVLDCPTLRHVVGCLPAKVRGELALASNDGGGGGGTDDRGEDVWLTNASVLESIFAEEFRTDGVKSGDAPTLVVHLAPPEVAAHPLYERLIACFPAETQHAVCAMPSRPLKEDGPQFYVSDTVSVQTTVRAGNNKDSEKTEKAGSSATPQAFAPVVDEVAALRPVSHIFLSSAVNQAKLSLLDPYTFPPPMHSKMAHPGVDLWHATRNGKALERDNIVQGANMMRFHLRPVRNRGFDVGSVPLHLTGKQTGRFGLPRAVTAPRIGQPLVYGGSFALTGRTASNDLQRTDRKLSRRVRSMRERLIEASPGELTDDEDVYESASDSDGADSGADVAMDGGGISPSINADSIPLELVILGTGSSAPSRYRNVSGLYLSEVRAGDDAPAGLLLDCGEGTYGQLVRRFGPAGAIDALRGLRMIWISHIHADHHAGIPKILTMRSRLMPTATPLLVGGPHMLLPFLKRYEEQVEHLGFHFVDNKHLTHEAATEHSPCTAVDRSSIASGETIPASQALSAVEAATAGLKLPAMRTVRVDHCPEAYGIVLGFNKESGGVQAHVSYSGDTVFCPEFADASAGARLMVHEATFDEELAEEAHKKRHSTVGQALQCGKRAGVERLLLTHFSQRYPKLPGQTEAKWNEAVSATAATLVAFDLMRLRVDLPYPPSGETGSLVNALLGAGVSTFGDEDA